MEKTFEYVRKNRDIKLVTTDEKRNKLVSEPCYHTTKRFSENLLATEMKKTKVKMNKPRYLGMSILDISKTLMYNYIIRILIALLFMLKLRIFLKIFLMMLSHGMIHVTMMKMIKDLFQ